MPATSPNTLSISPLLKTLVKNFTGQGEVRDDEATEIAAALALIFENRLSDVQCSSLLSLLSISGKDRNPSVLAKCAERMRDAAAQVEPEMLLKGLVSGKRYEGSYVGGLCDIVGTGGDGHATFNVSTTASILASSLLRIAKHGNRASSSTSGSADLLQALRPQGSGIEAGPRIDAITSETLPSVYQNSNYAFLFAPQFHPGMKHVASVRKDLGFRTIFNLLGPLVNPVDRHIEARIIGVAEPSLGPVFAEALRLSRVGGGRTNVMVVCGAESLDEISCAGITHVWTLSQENCHQPWYETKVEEFQLQPSDFGLASHPLSEVSGGKLPKENAEILMKLLENKLPKNNPILDFVLINTAALFVISGICNADTSYLGHGDDGKVIKETGPGGHRWKEGVRRARWAIESGEALASLKRYIDVTHSYGGR